MKTLQSLKLSKSILIDSYSPIMTISEKTALYLKLGKITLAIKKLDLEEIRKIKNPLFDH